MILTIDIDREAPGVYVARACSGDVPVTEPVVYDCIETAIREQALAVPPGFAHFLEFTYGGMSTGTYPVADVPGQASAMTSRLMSLMAHLHDVSGVGDTT